MFGAAIVFRQPWYRYAGLATFGLAIARGLAVDTRAMDPLSRTLALILLGAVLLAVGYAYTRVREHMRRNRPEVEPDEAADVQDADQL
jgi:uncharacterized membrane protein